MASIRKVINADGGVKYRAQIVIKQKGVIVHRESKSFDRQKLAKDWAMRREIEIQENSVYAKQNAIPIKEIISAYLERFPPSGRTKRFDIEKLLTRDIALIDINALTAGDLIGHIQDRNLECKPQTAANDLIWLKNIVVTMRSVIGFKFDATIFDDARAILRKERLIAKSEHRERIPTSKEILALAKYFGKGSPAYECFWFSLYSARRISETTRLEWKDIDHKKRTVIVRNLKDPRKKNVIKIAKLPAGAYKILMRQPKTSARVFPYNSKTIGKYFTDACKTLGIKDLHLHDCRHAATTYLFKKGLQIQEVQKITLHANWATLSRYTNLKAEDVDI